MVFTESLVALPPVTIAIELNVLAILVDQPDSVLGSHGEAVESTEVRELACERWAKTT